MEDFKKKYEILSKLYDDLYPVYGHQYLNTAFTVELDSILILASKMLELSYGRIHDSTGRTIIKKYRKILAKHSILPLILASALNNLIDAWCIWTKYHPIIGNICL